MAETDQDKRHLPTPQRRQQARNDGRFAHSRELTGAFVLLVSICALWFFMPRLIGFLVATTEDSMRFSGAQASGESMLVKLRSVLWSAFIAAGPLLFVGAFIALAATWIQSSFQVFSGRISLDLNRMNPANGLGKILSAANLGRTAFGIVKVVSVIGVVLLGVRQYRQLFFPAPDTSLEEVMATAGSGVLQIALQSALVLVVFGVIDYGFRWWQHERSLMMTDEELREEMKAMTGNPQILANRKEFRRNLAASTTVRE